MEEIHMSPTPTPPMQEADIEDPCIIDVTDAAIDGVTVLICLCGLVGNGAVFWFRNIHIRRKTFTSYIHFLAIYEFASLLIVCISSLFYMIENVFCTTLGFLKYLRWVFAFPMHSYNTNLYFLMTISIESCVSILHPSSINRCPQRFLPISVLLCLLSTIFLIAMDIGCQTRDCRAAVITVMVLNFLIFAPPMIISNVVLFIKVLCGSQQGQPRRLHIVIFLTVLFFLLFGVPLSICNFLQRLGHHLLSSKVNLLLACTNSSINPFIYFLVGSCQRPCSFVSLKVAFRRVFEETEDNSAHSNQIPMDTLDPASQSFYTAPLNPPSTVAEGFLE